MYILLFSLDNDPAAHDNLLMFCSQKINSENDLNFYFRYDFVVLDMKMVKEKSFFLRIYDLESVFYTLSVKKKLNRF